MAGTNPAMTERSSVAQTKRYPGPTLRQESPAYCYQLHAERDHDRHARPCAGHPRLWRRKKGVDGRDKPGHDGDSERSRMERSEIRVSIDAARSFPEVGRSKRGAIGERYPHDSGLRRYAPNSPTNSSDTV